MRHSQALKLKMAADLMAAIQETFQPMIAALTKMAEALEPLITLLSEDYVETGEPPYGGRWSRRQMRIR